MKKVFLRSCLLLIPAILSLFIVFSCSKKDEAPDLTVTQNDIDLLIEHKKAIDAITEEYDKKIAAAPKSDTYKLINEGKADINSYLVGKGLSPETFMKKSKKILKCYLAFVEISEETLQKKIDMLKQNETAADIEPKIQAYKKAGETFYKEMTEELGDSEIELVRSNFERISSVVDQL